MVCGERDSRQGTAQEFFRSCYSFTKTSRVQRISTMPINQSDIEKVAQLAHLELDEQELNTFGRQMTEIVNYVEQLNELNTKDVEPALGGLTPEGEDTESSRADEIAGSLGQKTALAEAPDPASGHFRVPKVL